MKKMREQIERAIANAEKIQAEKDRIQAEKDRIQMENHMKELQWAKDEKETLQAAHKAQVEKDRILAENHEKEKEKLRKEAERVQEENHKKQLQSAREAKEQLQEAYRMQAEKERVQAERHAKELQRVQEERERLQKEKDRIQAENHEKELRRLQEAKQQFEEAHRLQEEARKLQEQIKREEEKKKMEELAKKIQQEAWQRIEKETWLREEAERNLKNGTPPIEYPTGEEIQAVRKQLQYKEGLLHFAVTGVAGSGKSSLINAFRGYRNSTSNKNPDIARTGTAETTEQIGRYCDPSRPWLVWYDIPGAGTLKVPDWQYFNDQGLYIFDIIIIVIDSRFTRIDVDLLFNCKRFGIPAFVVRSKANTHITNNIGDDDGDDDDGDDDNSQEKRFMRARDKFVTDTRQEFESILKNAGLPPQPVYIVAKNTLHCLIKGLKIPKDMMIIDEVELMKDIVRSANERNIQNLPPYI